MDYLGTCIQDRRWQDALMCYPTYFTALTHGCYSPTFEILTRLKDRDFTHSIPFTISSI